MDALVAEHPEVCPGAFVKMTSGEWTSARADYGVIVAVKTTPVIGGGHAKEAIFVFFPNHPKERLGWHTIDEWHLKMFWTVLWSPCSP